MVVVMVREYEAERDRLTVAELESRCEVGPTGKLSLHTDLLGDPLCRVRHSPAYLMLVAEMVGGEDKEKKREIVGMIRGCIKTVTCGKKLSNINAKLSNNNNDINNHNCLLTTIPAPDEPLPLFTKLAYILGLRVSPSHRRIGIGLKLVTKMEEWFAENGAEYCYMATENDNRPSINLFTKKCGYSKFRTPRILVHPVFAHKVRISNRASILQLGLIDAEALYRNQFSTVEFFPYDINTVLSNPLSLGTFLAVPSGSRASFRWPGTAGFLAAPPESWAVLSVWNCKDAFTLEVRGASRVKKALARATRVVDRAFPWLGLPSVPEVFRPFGLHFLYGLGGEGPDAVGYVRALCGVAHNLARERGCGVVVTEVGSREPLRIGIPYWKRLSCAEDLWCIKRLGEEDSDVSVGDWTKSSPGLSIFVDPRDV
ncbi:acyl-CoA N-acyltransferases super family protein [Striga asiatica]|uniref:Acyl-CoA N-acyltransferases super family protein n=1 Tax=Striga asiatica TaxID=4170 RepID=A0A5A7P7V0_STRAF|nr:acyl-CoA N-acyltransferases super family protein [Striga asiatica]